MLLAQHSAYWLHRHSEEEHSFRDATEMVKVVGDRRKHLKIILGANWD